MIASQNHKTEYEYLLWVSLYPLAVKDAKCH